MYFQAREPIWLACTKGLANVASSALLLTERKLTPLHPHACCTTGVHLLWNKSQGPPRVWTFPCEMRHHPSHSPWWWRQVSGSAAFETSALLTGVKNLKKLNTKVNIDLGHLENSDSYLEAQLYSLAEAVQNFTLWVKKSLSGTGRNLLLLYLSVRDN